MGQLYPDTSLAREGDYAGNGEVTSGARCMETILLQGHTFPATHSSCLCHGEGPCASAWGSTRALPHSGWGCCRAEVPCGSLCPCAP